MEVANLSRQVKLHRAGLIVGLAGVLAQALFFMSVSESPFSIYGIFSTLLVSVLPYLLILSIGWLWPLVGGIILTIVGISWAIALPVGMRPTNTPYFVLLMAAVLGLPLLASGILFLLSVRERYRE